MACGCRRTSRQYVWVPAGSSAESDDVVVYKTEIEAKAKVLRAGGQYITVSKQG